MVSGRSRSGASDGELTRRGSLAGIAVMRASGTSGIGPGSWNSSCRVVAPHVSRTESVACGEDVRTQAWSTKFCRPAFRSRELVRSRAAFSSVKSVESVLIVPPGRGPIGRWEGPVGPRRVCRAQRSSRTGRARELPIR